MRHGFLRAVAPRGRWPGSARLEGSAPGRRPTASIVALRLDPAVGLFDLDRNIRPVGRAYKELIEQWGEVLPVQSVCLQVPLVEPDQYEEPWAQRRRDHMRKIRETLSRDLAASQAQA